MQERSVMFFDLTIGFRNSQFWVFPLFLFFFFSFFSLNKHIGESAVYGDKVTEDEEKYVQDGFWIEGVQWRTGFTATAVCLIEVL